MALHYYRVPYAYAVSTSLRHLLRIIPRLVHTLPLNNPLCIPVIRTLYCYDVNTESFYLISETVPGVILQRAAALVHDLDRLSGPHHPAPQAISVDNHYGFCPFSPCT